MVFYPVRAQHCKCEDICSKSTPAASTLTLYILLVACKSIERLFFLLKFIKTEDYLVLANALSGIMSLLPILYLICHLGETVTISFIDLSFSAYDIPWFLCPVRIQNYIVPIVRATKTPVYFKSIAGMECTNDTFKRVRRSIND